VLLPPPSKAPHFGWVAAFLTTFLIKAGLAFICCSDGEDVNELPLAGVWVERRGEGRERERERGGAQWKALLRLGVRGTKRLGFALAGCSGVHQR
jgi:hypothetical protein